MSEAQALALVFMVGVGIPGIYVICEGKGFERILGLLWAAFWMLPPLIILWIKGVLG